MSDGARRVIVVEPDDRGREVVARRLRAQGFLVDSVANAATGADLALCAPPMAVVADLWMPRISGVQLCQLLRSEPATQHVPVVLRGEADDPRSRFWAGRAGASAYVPKGRMGELVRALEQAALRPPAEDAFFLQLGAAAAVDIQERIARHLDTALFESVIVGEVRALASSGSQDRLFDLLSQFLPQVQSYRWLALQTRAPTRLALHCHPRRSDAAEAEARKVLGVRASVPCVRIEDEDAQFDAEGPEATRRQVVFAGADIASIALAPTAAGGAGATVLDLVARELGGAIRMATLIEDSHRLACTDGLTGLLNRRAFHDAVRGEISRSVRQSTPLSLLLLDVDHFKSVNDAHGHAAGDRVLEEVANMIRSTLRLSDVSARWGGEEMVIALPDTDREGALSGAERLRLALEGMDARSSEDAHIPVTASIGVAVLRDGDTVDSLVARADRAMYAAKAGGRNRVVSEGEERALPLREAG